MSEIEIEIDGNLVKAKQGDSIIKITDREGIEVPRFCYHKKLSVAANCRMCLVDVEALLKHNQLAPLLLQRYEGSYKK